MTAALAVTVVSLRQNPRTRRDSLVASRVTHLTRRRCGGFSSGSNGNTKVRRVWLIDRGVPTEEVLAEMRAADPPMHYLVGTPKSRLTGWRSYAAM